MVTAEVPSGSISTVSNQRDGAPRPYATTAADRSPTSKRDAGGDRGEGERVAHRGDRVGREPGQLLPEPGIGVDIPNGASEPPTPRAVRRPRDRVSPTVAMTTISPWVVAGLRSVSLTGRRGCWRA